MTMVTLVMDFLRKRNSQSPLRGGVERHQALEHAWAWFELHSKQRMQTVNFYMIVMAALLAACATALKDNQEGFLCGLGITMSLVSALFYGLDRRARELVKIGERALEIEEEKLAAISSHRIKLVAESARTGRKGLTYGKLFDAMFCSFGAGGVLIFCFFFSWKWVGILNSFTAGH